VNEEVPPVKQCQVVRSQLKVLMAKHV